MTESAQREAARSTTSAAQPTPIAAQAFKIAAVAEAISWAALLVAMFFKWVTHTTERGVQIVGPIHGTFFLLYCASVLWCYRSLRWRPAEVLLGIASAFPPFLTVWFERRMAARGRLS